MIEAFVCVCIVLLEQFCQFQVENRVFRSKQPGKNWRLVDLSTLGPEFHQSTQFGHPVIQQTVGFQQSTVVQGQEIVKGDVDVLNVSLKTGHLKKDGESNKSIQVG